MAQIIPSITSLPVDSSAAPSVEDIQDRLPSICVDYLSHDWSEEDVWASWRNMTRHKHEIANGVRLENASWRTWQKQRNKLKTISPETLNWLKDSDVTWLYGPLHTASVEPVRPPREATTAERLGIDGVGIDRPMERPVVSGPVKKPILKHRTLSEMLTIPMPASPILESYASGADGDVDDIDDHRPGLIQTKSDTNIIRSRNGMGSGNRRKSPSRAPISGKNTPKDGQQTPVNQIEDPLHTGGSSKRHISFNTFVEQCMAIDDPSEMPTIDSDEDEMLEMRSSSSRSSRPSLPRTASTGSAGSDHLTIAKIAPTMLKTQAFSNSDQLPQMRYQPPAEYLSPVAHFGGSPSPREDWGDEGDGGSHDYFGGPTFQADETKVQSVPVHQGYRAPTVSQPPSQPKWRQGQQASPAPGSAAAGVGGQPSSIDSSTSSSSASLQSASPQSSTPVPARSILKVRAPGPTPPEPASPPSNYFNYTPSAATGIGGMRGQFPDGVNTGASGTSPLVSPAGVDDRGGRGRTTSRERGSSAYDRSVSRGTTSSSTSGTSISPGASRSPVGAQRKPQPPQAQVADRGMFVENVDAKPSEAEDMEIEEDEAPERGTTPTPHSSPQIALRRLHDTSPASLPHYSSQTSLIASPDLTHSPTSPLPWTDPPNSLSPPPNTTSTNHSGGRATTAQVSTQAKPTIQNNKSGGEAVHQAESAASGAAAAAAAGGPRLGGSAFGRLQGQGQRRVVSGGDAGLGGYHNNDDDDGSSIMGRAANIANTAKDLFGALWYGANQPSGGAGAGAGGPGTGAGASAAQGSDAQNQAKKTGRHKRGASMG